MKFTKKLLSLLLCFALIASVALCMAGCETTPAKDEVQFTFVVVDAAGTETKFDITTDKATVGEALEEEGLIAGEESEFGLYVKTVNGITADYDVDGTYWGFYINGESAMTGVDSTDVTAGATYTFKVEGAADTTGNVLGEGKTSFTFVVVDLDQNETTYTINTDETTVGAALLALGLIAGEEGEYGLYVKTVGGITLDYDKDGKYWGFYVDGEYAMTGVDATNIVAGATYTFKAE